MSTQDRLDAYLAAEQKILLAQSVTKDGRTLQMAELAEVRQAISTLQAQIARERLAVRGHSSLGYSVATFPGSDR